MQKDFRLKPASIILRQHSLKDLREIYTEELGKEPKKDITHLQLVHELANSLSISALLETWSDKIFAHNTSFKFYNVTDLKSNKSIENGKTLIKEHFTKDAWEKITGTGYIPKTLSNDGHLLHISELNEKTVFLFAAPGRAKEVIEDLNVRYLVQPQFTLAVWDNKSSTIQLRGVDLRGTALAKIRDYLTKGETISPTFKQVMVQDRDQAKKLAKALKGRAHRGKFVNSKAEVSEATYVSAPDKDLYETQLVKDAEKSGYRQDSAGIDFVWNKESFTVWVGFSNGSFWVRAGEVSEDLIQYLQGKILSL